MAARALLDPATLAKLGRLDLKARFVVEGFISGMHRSPYKGFSVEFAQYRGYTPGDDPRHIDWRVFARNERYVVKQYEEETNLVAHLVLDASESMGFVSPAAATGPDGARLAKLDYGKLAVAALAHLVLGQSDAVACAVVDEGIREQVERSTRDIHLERICALLESTVARGRSALGPALHRLGERVRRRGVVVLISDCLDDVARTVDGLRRLRHAGHEVVLLHLLDEHELTFPFEGLVRFEGLEGLGDLLCQPRLVRQAYLDELHAFLARLRAECGKLRVDYVQLSTATPPAVALAAYLASRERLLKSRGGR